MKLLMTLVALLVSTAAVAQIPTFPWNPDGNGDGVIGSSDLIGLLTVYGQEFQNAIVSENQESALVYIGEKDLFLCKNACQNLPGNWALPEPEDLRSIAPMVVDTIPYNWPSQGGVGNFWLNYDSPYRGEDFDLQYPYFRAGVFNVNVGYENSVNLTSDEDYPWRCYCSIKQLPRVEYITCNVINDPSCPDSLVGDGWYPMGGVSDSGTQAFWRFAQ